MHLGFYNQFKSLAISPDGREWVGGMPWRGVGGVGWGGMAWKKYGPGKSVRLVCGRAKHTTDLLSSSFVLPPSSCECSGG